VRASFLPDIFHASIAEKTFREIITAYRGAIEFSAETETFSKSVAQDGLTGMVAHER
jgi:hypothetical protein